MKTSTRAAIFAIALAASASAVQAATYNYSYTFDGTDMALDMGSADPMNQFIAIGDTFVVELRAEANRAWQVDTGYTSSIDGSFVVSGSAWRTGTMTATQSLNGMGGAFTTIAALGQGSIHAGGQNIEYATADVFDTLSVTYTLLSDNGVGTTIKNSDVNVFGSTFWTSANISYISYADAAPVPLPAAGWVLLTGLGGLAALRRRKKAA